MNNFLHSPQTDQPSSRVTKMRGRKAGSKRRTVLYSLLTCAVWCGLAYGGYELAAKKKQAQQAEIEAKLLMHIEEIRSESNARIDDLHAELDELTAIMTDVSEKIESIREELQMTSESITGNDDTRLALQAQIHALDKQLEELRAAIRKLEDAARVY